MQPSKYVFGLDLTKTYKHKKTEPTIKGWGGK